MSVSFSYVAVLRDNDSMYPNVVTEKLNVGSISAVLLSSSTAKSSAFRFLYSVATHDITLAHQRVGHKSMSNNIT